MEDHTYAVFFFTPISPAEQANERLSHALNHHFAAYRFINSRLLICRCTHPVAQDTEPVSFSAVMDFAGLSRKRWAAALLAHLEYRMDRDALKMSAFRESSGGDGCDEMSEV